MKLSVIRRSPHRTALPVLLAALAAGAGHAPASAQESTQPPAVDLSGEWVLTVESPNGTGTRDVTFVQKDGKLTGTISSSVASGDLEGTVEGSKVSFLAVVMMDSGAFEIWYEATWVDGELKEGVVDFGDYGSGSFTGRRKEEGGGRQPPLPTIPTA